MTPAEIKALADRCADYANPHEEVGVAYMRAALAEAATALRSFVDGGWRPIETAPKDETEIVGHDQKTGTSHVTWADRWGDWYDRDSHYYSEAPPFQPTHWMPLPTPPAVEGEAGE